MTARTPRGVARAAAVVSLAAPLAAVLALGAAPAAFASGGFVQPPTPANGSLLTDGSTTSVQAQGQLDPGSGQATITLTGPGGYKGSTTWSCFSLSSCKSTVLSADLAPSGTPRANGKWVASLTGSATGSRTFYTDLPPTSTPANVAAQATDPQPGATTGTVALSWSYTGSEPDLWGFRLADGQGWTADVAASDASCDSNGACHYAKQYDNAPGSTQTYSFTVAALRSSCKAAGCSDPNDTVVGSASSPAQAQLVTPLPPASPSPGATSGSGGGATGSGAGTTGAGSTGKQGKAGKPIVIPTFNPVLSARKNYALRFNSFSPSLGIPKLPPLPATTFSESVGGSDQSYQPTLPYKAQPAHTTTSVFSSSPLAAVTGMDARQLARNLAAALVLLAVAAHVRVFVKAHRSE